MYVYVTSTTEQSQTRLPTTQEKGPRRIPWEPTVVRALLLPRYMYIYFLSIKHHKLKASTEQSCQSILIIGPVSS